MTTLAGSTAGGFANGTGGAAKFSLPEGLNVDSSGNVYVADTNNSRIRKVTSAGVVTTIAGSGTSGYLDGTTSTAQFNTPTSVEIDAAGNLWVTGSGDNHIREIAGGYVSTAAGWGRRRMPTVRASPWVSTPRRAFDPMPRAACTWATSPTTGSEPGERHGCHGRRHVDRAYGERWAVAAVVHGHVVAGWPQRAPRPRRHAR